MENEMVKVSELTEAENINDEDIMMIVQNGINKKIKAKEIGCGTRNEVILSILQIVFPIGSTYITQEDTNPSTILNFGTWERIKGKVCLGLDEEDENLNTIGNIGGEKTHRITTSEIPYKMDAQRNSDTGTNWNNQGITANENNNEMSIMQPYEIVGYMWIRRL